MPFEGEYAFRGLKLCIVYRNEFLIRLAIAMHKVRLSGPKLVYSFCIVYRRLILNNFQIYNYEHPSLCKAITYISDSEPETYQIW